MLKKLRVKNFKAALDMEIQFTPLTMLIGGNSCGKSTVLQALDFLRSIATRDIDEYLSERGWDFSDIRSQLIKNNKKPIKFVADFAFTNDEKNSEVEWSFSINYEDQWVIKETIINTLTGETLLSHGNANEKENRDTPYPFSHFKLTSSGLKLIDGASSRGEEEGIAEGLRDIKRFLSASSSFELLSPERMRSRGNRGVIPDIGMGGEKLVAFLHGMNSHQRDEFNRIFSNLLGYDAQVLTTTRGQPGWIEMHLNEIFPALSTKMKNEIFPTLSTKIKTRHISDGLLRIMAFAAISTTASSGMILLDEIEDGINPHVAESVIALFKGITETSACQVIATTHSTVFVDYLAPAELVFLWKQPNGSLACKSLFSTEEMMETLDFLHPGEVLLNYERDEILQKLNAAPGGNA